MSRERRGLYGVVALLALILGGGTLLAEGSSTPTWRDDIKPLLCKRCLSCHGEVSTMGCRVLERYRDLCEGEQPPARAGDLSSPFLRVLVEEQAADEAGPDHRLLVDEDQAALIEAWIQAGCPRD
ncbi:MAG: hypothetical protein GF403_01855 [Candidatus Coatesbacteria bacterium]|nr:hypothetical protein [Candidatus Coatesbacteria bacterium]